MKETSYNLKKNNFKDMLRYVGALPRSAVGSGTKAFLTRLSAQAFMLTVDTPWILAKRKSWA